MPRFYIPPYAWNPARFALDTAEIHHALDVLRIKAGDRATLFNGEGAEAEVEVLKTSKQAIEFHAISIGKSASLACRITLAQAVPKGKNMELIIEKATELGVTAIAPLLSERTIVRGSESEHQRKQHKWQRVAIEACKQCGQNWLPAVHRPLAPKTFFESCGRFDLMLIASLQNDARPLKQILSSHAVPRTLSVLILIGPEGDFTPAEMALAKSAGCQPLTLGPIILRTETAAIYSLSVLNHELQA